MSTNLSESSLPLPPPLVSAAERAEIAQMSATFANTCAQGCIYFAIGSNRLKRQAVEDALRQSLEPKGLSFSQVVLAERENQEYHVYIPDPVSFLLQSPAGPPKLFFIHGLSELIRAQTESDDSKVADVARLLNYRRELFRERALCALFWLDVETVPYLMQKAPDFWAFRSGTAQFTETPAGLESSPGSVFRETAGPRQDSAELDEKLRQLATYRRRSPPDENAVANLLLDIGRIQFGQRDLQAALDSLQEALQIFVRLGLEPRARDAKVSLARTFQVLGSLDEAEQYLKDAIAIDLRLHHEPNLATDYNNLSQIYQARGQLDEAEQWLRKAIEIAERLGNEPNLAIDYNNLSVIYQARGQLDEAEQWLRKAIAIDERLGNEPKLATRYNNLSQIYQARGQLEEAEQWLRKAIAIDERLADEPNLATGYNNLSQIYQDRGQLEEAEQWLRKAIEIDERLADEPKLAVRYNNLSQIYKARGQLKEAEHWLRKAIALLELKGPSKLMADLQANLESLAADRST